MSFLLVTVVGSIFEAAIVLAAAIAGPYLLLASAHFIGLLFHENEAALEAVYL